MKESELFLKLDGELIPLTRGDMNIKPIETVYRGIKFRSKLEAHWAVYFDRCGVKWEYEPQGFDLGDGIKYLPDFLLHDVVCWDGNDDKSKDLWVEVKGVMDSDSEEKIERFAFGDRETRMKNIKEIAERQLADSRFDLIDGLKILCPLQRSILVVGQMPLEDNFYHENGLLDRWVIDTFHEAVIYRLFYNSRTINNYNKFVFPIINNQLKMEIRECDRMSEYEFRKTMSALDYARNYRFDHKKNTNQEE